MENVQNTQDEGVLDEETIDIIDAELAAVIRGPLCALAMEVAEKTGDVELGIYAEQMMLGFEFDQTPESHARFKSFVAMVVGYARDHEDADSSITECYEENVM